MIRTFFITGIILAALGRIAVAQEEGHPPRKLEDANRAEDLQILSAIVTENVNGLYGVESRRVAGGTDATGPMSGAGALSSAGAWLYVAGGHPTTPAAPGRALAEYLPDYGVVVQMEVAPPREPVTKKSGQAEKPRPPSRWERTRQRLAGDDKTTAFEQAMCSSCHEAGVKLDNGKAYTDYDGDGQMDVYLAGREAAGHPAPTRKQLIEKLVETLAENGHNLRNLSAAERVTFSVSWQQPAVRSDPHQVIRGYLNDGSGKPKAIDKPKPGPNDAKPTADPNSPSAKEGSDASGNRSPRSNAELSGDLLLTKGRYAEAAQSFQQALDGVRAAAGDPRAPTDASAEQERSLTLKLAYARAHSTAAADEAESSEDAKTAQQHIKAVAEYEKLLSRHAPRRSRTGRPAIAGRVSITASKSQLDEVASGKLTREQFAQQVQTRGFDSVRTSQ